jgi:phosphoribosylpyrophosphate synthetase
VRGCDVFIIQPTNSPAENIMELILIIDAAVRASAKTVTAVIHILAMEGRIVKIILVFLFHQELWSI